jgi:hypothetical protein
MEAGAKPIEVHSVAVDPASLSTLTGVGTDVTVTGVSIGDEVISAIPSEALTTGLIPAGGFVKTTDTVTVNIFNGSSGTVDGVSKTWYITVIKNTAVTD